MKSTFALNIASMAVFLPSSFASPINPSSTPHKREAPAVCQPTGAQADSSYKFWDQTETCQYAGVANACCITYLGNLGCQVKSKEDLQDLKSVLGKQISKSHQFSSTSVGRWRASYDLFMHEKVDPAILQMWYTALGPDNDFDPDNQAVFGSLQFTADLDDGRTRVTVGCS